jgi:hypothetical protein
MLGSMLSEAKAEVDREYKSTLEPTSARNGVVAARSVHMAGASTGARSADRSEPKPGRHMRKLLAYLDTLDEEGGIGARGHVPHKN